VAQKRKCGLKALWGLIWRAIGYIANLQVRTNKESTEDLAANLENSDIYLEITGRDASLLITKLYYERFESKP